MTFARVRALIVVGVLALAAVVFVVVALVKDTQSGATGKVTCPPGAVLVDMSLPEPKQITVKVFNGTDNNGWGSQITEDFKNRKFKTQEPEDNKKVVEGVAVLRFGPKTVGSAHLLRAFFLGEATQEYNAKREDAVVDVVIGTKFRQLATPTEMRQSLADLGEPKVPAGACPMAKPAAK